ncbi:SWIM zinc finger family protein [Eleftheria terrae]|uniref:SWIM zinc finger family protein n=1 Tax=Eleftheria terrae TaxID=1597781 RepID=UPI00263A9392|nr:SWIM zinc finger family protein [Eleftheria terrae]WKB53448.1 SWIM zinc finger family protein [Eleftheria terrae]
MSFFSTEAVLALAPDDSSAKAARGLTSPAKWPTLGHNDQAVWGECQGSGSKPYQTQVDLAGPAFRCSCPSRKFPCKHGLALMLMRADDAGRFATGEPPAWVAEWLASRRDKAEKKEQRAAQRADAPETDVAAAREGVLQRQARRWQRIEAGLTELERWMGDLLRQGLAALDAQAGTAWRSVGARLVDAQAPALAAWLEDTAALIGSRPDWPAPVLARLGRLQLLVDAVRRRDSLPPAVQADLRATLGWPLDRDEVLAGGERVGDCWSVLGQVCEERDQRLAERRTWLAGQRSGRRALVLEFAHGGQGFETAWLTGSGVEAELCFYPSAHPLRALLVAPAAVAAPDTAWTEAEWAALALPDEWLALREAFARHAWLPVAPLLLRTAQLQRRDDAWQLLAGGRALALALDEADLWQLLACSGGAPLQLAGEWDGQRLRPFTAWCAEGVWTLGQGGAR